MRYAAAALTVSLSLGGLIGVGCLAGCTQEDARAQVQLSRVDQIAEATVLEPETGDGMTVDVSEIVWSAGQAWAGERLLPIPDVPIGQPTTVYPPRSTDLPDAGEPVLLYLAYQAPSWVTVLVGDPRSGAFTGSSKRAENANEALAAGRKLRGEAGDPQQVVIDLIEGARAIQDADDGHGDPGTTGGLMREVTPLLSPKNGGPQ